MYARLSRDAYRRRFGDIGYVINQTTREDRVFDGVGAHFLEQIMRQPRPIEILASEAAAEFTPEDRHLAAGDFQDFVDGLRTEGFVVTGCDAMEIEAKDKGFSYATADAKTAPLTSLLPHRHEGTPETGAFLGKHFRSAPRVFGFQMELTSRCNETCRHCYLPPSRIKQDMETSMVLDLLDQLAAMGTLSVTLSGGECLLHPDFISILERARNNDFLITVLSNLTRLTDDHAAILKACNVSLVQASLYSTEPAEHDAITRVAGSHAKTVSAIEKLRLLDVPVQISCPVMRTNAHSYKKVLAWAYKRRMKAYTDHIMMARSDFTQDNLDARINEQETEILLREMAVHDLEYRANLRAAPPSDNEGDTGEQPLCGVGLDNLCVAADGMFYPCSGWQGYPLGNAKLMTIEKVWNHSPELHRLRRITRKDFPTCMSCDARKFCAMCLVRNFNESGGDMLKLPEFFCKVARINKAVVEEYRSAGASEAGMASAIS